MSATLEQSVKEVCQKYGHDKGRLMDIIREVNERLGCVAPEAMDLIAQCVSAPRVDVASVVSFYAFYSDQPKGKVVIRLCNDYMDLLQGADRVGQAFAEELGIDFGQTTPDGKITLEYAPCIGMCDQTPAAMVNDVMMTHLSTDAVRQIVRGLKQGAEPAELVHSFGDGNNSHELIHSMVLNNIRKSGPVVLAEFESSEALDKALAMTPVEVIRDVKTARLRGRGGAGFPTGMKWDFTRAAAGEKKYVLCNADEGEPGTFKDRVILTERADLMFEGMTIAGYAIGSDAGILYLRGEYAYLRPYLEQLLLHRRHQGLLGANIRGKMGFNFDIRIQLGAGAYICGEETALISSCEGQRGDPKNRPPFPAQKGYMGCPTVVNNVETYCCIARILEKGPGWFAQLGSHGSPGTKLLSISGDCKRPGVYEVPFGIKLCDVLELAGAENPGAVQVGGPSGQLVGSADFHRTICYDDLATGGSIIIYNRDRNILEIVSSFMEFFVEESCGYCTPCRVGNVLLKERVDRILAGRGEPSDLDYLQELGATVKTASRCGLGQTSANPVLSSLKNFRDVYENAVKANETGMQMAFDISAALSDASKIAGRKSVIFNGSH